jgi:hypothetical protein
MWDALAASLAPTFSVLRYDTRGHGGTSAPGGAYSFEQLVADVTGPARCTEGRAYPLRRPLHGRHDRPVPRVAGAATAGQAGDRQFDQPHSTGGGGHVGPAHRQARAQGTGAMAEATLGRWFTPAFRAAHPEIMTRIAALIAATPVAGLCRLRRGHPPPRHHRPADGDPHSHAGRRRRRRSRHAAGGQRSRLRRQSPVRGWRSFPPPRIFPASSGRRYSTGWSRIFSTDS